jgi:hypothetical protein
MKDLYVQYGCGLSAPPGWLNFDASPTLWFERLPLLGRLYSKNAERFPANVRYGDIVRGLPIPADSCRGIYCSHVLEHLAAAEADLALAHTRQYLQPGGTFRLVVPDLRQLAAAYLADPSSDASDRFMRDTNLGREQRPRNLPAFLKSWLGNSPHLWMWDEHSMAAKLSEHGFSEIRRAQFNDAEDRRFNEVEDRERFDGCLAMQCRKT